MSNELRHIESHWNLTVIPSILEQYKDSAKWQECLKTVIDQMQIAEDAAIELTTVLDFKSEVPTGYRLDYIAGLVNCTRMAGESDSAFYSRFITRLGYRRAGTPDHVINSVKILSQDPAPQYLDEAPATFFVYDGPRPGPTDSDPWEEGGRQLSRAQVRNLAPAGVLGLPGAVIQLADGSFLGIAEAVSGSSTPVLTEDGQRVLTEDGNHVVTEIPPDGFRKKMFVVVADDRDITREVLLADNNGAIVVTPQSVPVRVVLSGPTVPSIPTIETEWNGVPVDAVRIKDLPDAGDENGYMVRDSDTEGTVKSRAMDGVSLDELWDTTPAEGEG